MRRNALVVLVALAGVASAQDKLDPAKLVAHALKLRHDGSFDAAAAFLDEAVRLLPQKSDERRTVQYEAYELALVQGNFEKAARIVRGTNRSDELTALANHKAKGETALKLARESKDPLVEARVLRTLGKDQEAADAFAKAGAAGAVERGDLLLKLGKNDEAAKAFESAGEIYRRASALDKLKDPMAPTIWESAKVEQKSRLELLLNRAKEVKGRHDSATDPVQKERARFALADAYGNLVEGYERYSIVLEKTGDKATASKLAELTLQFAAKERQLLTDGGADKFGLGLVRWKKLDERDRRLEDRARSLK